MRLILIAGVLVVVLVATVFIINQRTDECHWVAPLKTDYVLCNDGKVREK